MSLILSEEDKQKLSGARGEAARLAMLVLTRMAEVYGAPELMDITQAHIDGCALMADSGLSFAETLANEGGKVAVPTTLNMIPLDLQNWNKWKVSPQFAKKAARIVKAYTDMGCVPTYTCAPYQGYLTPRFGQQIAWGESNAIAYANSVLGARTNRYGDYLDICMALTGRAPKTGLHLKENRKGQVLIVLSGIDPSWMERDIFYPILGHLIGRLVQDRIPVLQGLPVHITGDQLKSFGAAAASSGAVGLYHIVGVTPEAPTLQEAFQGGLPDNVLEIKAVDLANSYKDLSTGNAGDRLSSVVLGCPHFSYHEFSQLAAEISTMGKPKHPGVRFVVLTSDTAYSLLKRSNFMPTLESFGVEIVLDTCVFHSPLISGQSATIMTNSGKCAYYGPGELSLPVVFASLSDCVRSASEGQVILEQVF